ncbi:hypothetical protein JTB14_013434 [Gonioctena quinquepunctata]|nr:hypothetical protein JTB14_013434 [Gonioctena quinquepunctata]
MGCQNNHCIAKGKVSLRFEIEERPYETEFTVLEGLHEEIILGMPFLRKYEGIIDVSRNCIYFGSTPRQTVYWDVANVSNKQFVLPEFEVDQFSEETKEKVMEIVSDFPDVFSETIRQPQTEACLHEIKVSEEKPFRQFRYGKLSEERKKIVHDEISKLLEAGVVVPSASEYCSPVVLVPKKDGRLRFCVDYREINKIIIPEVPNLPPIQETVREMGQAKLFTH